MYCKHCGKEIDDEAIFCSSCGEQINDSLSTDDKQSSTPRSGKVVAAVVFLVLGIMFLVATIVVTFVTMFLVNYTDTEVLLLVCMIVSLVPLAINIGSLVKLCNTVKAKDLTAIAIVTLIFSNLIAGIIMLTIKDEDLKCNKK